MKYLMITALLLSGCYEMAIDWTDDDEKGLASVHDEDGSRVHKGTGFFVGPHTLVTAQHVAQTLDRGDYTFTFGDNKEMRYPGRLIIKRIVQNERKDIAVIEFNPEIVNNPNWFELCDDADRGEGVVVVGYNNLYPEINDGEILSHKAGYLLTDAYAEHGFSGGPMLSTDGTLCVKGMLIHGGKTNIGDLDRSGGPSVSRIRQALAGATPHDFDPDESAESGKEIR